MRRFATAAGVRLFLVPLLCYAACFVLLTWPLVLSWPTHLFADDGDGFVYVWNVWWMREALVELHQPFWHSTFVYYPEGSTLLAHSLNPISGVIGLLLPRSVSAASICNLAVFLSFAVGGLGAFLLAYREVGHWGGALLAGFVFSFSAYHFAHAQGHLCLTSLHLLPFFVLAWLALLERPRLLAAVAAAVTLFLNLLCGHYYFLYCVLAGATLALWEARRRGALFLLRRPHLRPTLVFLLLALVLTGPPVVGFARIARSDPLIGSHDPEVYSLDLLAPFIPGAFSRFAKLTEPYWDRLPADPEETSVYLGWTVVALLAFVWVRRRQLSHLNSGRWFAVVGVFGVLALGPRLTVCGIRTPGVVLPYALLDAVPGISIGGVPIRMMAMVTLGASVLTAIGVMALAREGRRARRAALAALLLLAVEHLPAGIPATPREVPAYVTFLARRTGREPVIDTVARDGRALYYQTHHRRPLAFGYVSRLTTSTSLRAEALQREVANAVASGDLRPLARRGFGTLVVPASARVPGAEPLTVFQDGTATVLDLDPGRSASPASPGGDGP